MTETVPKQSNPLLLFAVSKMTMTSNELNVSSEVSGRV